MNETFDSNIKEAMQ